MEGKTIFKLKTAKNLKEHESISLGHMDIKYTIVWKKVYFKGKVLIVGKYLV